MTVPSGGALLASNLLGDGLVPQMRPNGSWRDTARPSGIRHGQAQRGEVAGEVLTARGQQLPLKDGVGLAEIVRAAHRGEQRGSS